MSTPEFFTHSKPLWQALTAAQREQCIAGFYSSAKDETESERAGLDAMLMQFLKLRPATAENMPIAKKAQHLSRFTNMEPILVLPILGEYHLRCQGALMGAFLDGLGIKHENGHVEDFPKDAPAPEKLKEAATAMKGKFSADDALLYFRTLYVSDSTYWAGLPGAWSNFAG